MTDEEPFLAGPNLSSIAGLKEAGILESFHFDPVRGLAGVIYTTGWIRILRMGMPIADPFFTAAILTDDPVAMRMLVEREATRLAQDRPSEDATPRKPGRGGKTRR